MRNTNPRSLGFKKHYQNSYIDKDPGECETEFSLGSIMGIDGARPGNYEYEISNGLNAGQHIGFQANLNL